MNPRYAVAFGAGTATEKANGPLVEIARRDFVGMSVIFCGHSASPSSIVKLFFCHFLLLFI